MSDDPTVSLPDSETVRIRRALFCADYGTIDGEHHKQWVIDQMVRALTGCPYEDRTGTDVHGTVYQYEVQGKSPEYHNWFNENIAGYMTEEEWEGIAP